MGDLMRKPEWLRTGFPDGQHEMKALLRRCSLHSVCEEASCPNMDECFSRGTACFMILGRRCTRNCRYCDVEHSTVPSPPDPDEPENVAKAVRQLGLKYAVITSVTRDDLPDGGATHFARTIVAVRKMNPECGVEVLIPEIIGSLQAVMYAKPDVLAHNLETVKELFADVRPKGDYEKSLSLLREAKRLYPGQKTKSGLMVGMGETDEMLISAFKDLRASGVDILTIGQYLPPSRKHWPVARFYTPEEFSGLKAAALRMGFSHVESGPLVRSSYHADELLKYM